MVLPFARTRPSAALRLRHGALRPPLARSPQGSPADLTVRVTGSAQLILRSALQRQQGVIGAGQRLQDLVELALGGYLLACLSVLMTNTMARVRAATRD